MLVDVHRWTGFVRFSDSAAEKVDGGLALRPPWLLLSRPRLTLVAGEVETEALHLADDHVAGDLVAGEPREVAGDLAARATVADEASELGDVLGRPWQELCHGSCRGPCKQRRLPPKPGVDLGL